MYPHRAGNTNGTLTLNKKATLSRRLSDASTYGSSQNNIWKSTIGDRMEEGDDDMGIITTTTIMVDQPMMGYNRQPDLLISRNFEYFYNFEYY